MKTKILHRAELPALLPQGWKKQVASDLGIHPQTVSRALAAGKGINYCRILHAAAMRYGTKVVKEEKR